jgi:hypothetical protein
MQAPRCQECDANTRLAEGQAMDKYARQAKNLNRNGKFQTGSASAVFMVWSGCPARPSGFGKSMKNRKISCDIYAKMQSFQ